MLAMIRADATATPQERETIAAILDGRRATALPQLLTRKQVASMINRTPRMVDYFGKHGYIRRVVLGNQGRATGYDADSVRAFLSGNAAKATKEGGAE